MKNRITSFVLLLLCTVASAAAAGSYWNSKTQLIPFRVPIVADATAVTYEDLDGDGDPDVLCTTILDGIPVMWIDDDDDMKIGDLEGDTDSDCLLIDLNRDGKFGGPLDLCIDWVDVDGDGVAEVQCVVSQASLNVRNYFDWGADYMYIIDFGEKDGIHNFINWNDLVLACWQEYGHSNFFSDYHGNTLFLKMHGSTFRINDLCYSWENPFIFFDHDGDNLSEMAIRCVDTPHFRPKKGEKRNPLFDKVDKEHDVVYSKHIDWASIAWDLDNDNGQGNECDFDFTLRFSGKGFAYDDQVHPIPGLRGLPEADKFLYDPRWRQLTELIYPDQTVAYDKILREGDWSFCWMVFDEDDDCNRWERVELYEPRDITKIGMEQGGLDHNKQADPVGDRGEFDTDYSGKGKLYMGGFDGRLHLFGAEWGAWRIDQGAHYFQGYGGLYPPAKSHVRNQPNPDKWATVRYADSDNNGFIDVIEYDLDGDFVFEEWVSLIELGVDDRCEVIDPRNLNYKQFNELFVDMAQTLWLRGKMAVQQAKRMGVNPDWYNFYRQPRTTFERYEYGYWLAFYLYHDMVHVARLRGDKELERQLTVAYYTNDWSSVRK